MPSLYEASRFARPDKQIRLLKLKEQVTSFEVDFEYTLSVHDFDDNIPPYVAISYAWGIEQPLSLPLKVNGFTVGVGLNCYTALWQMRWAAGPEYLWIDSICIDQSNNLEKNPQVANMGRVYKSADLVAACLGSGSEVKVLEVALGAGQSETVAVDALRNLLRCPYFDRLWIKQEIILAKEVYIYSGVAGLAFSKVERFLNAATLKVHHDEDIYKLQGLIEDRRRFSAISEKLGYAATLTQLVDRYGHSECSEPKDKIYAFAGMLNTFLPSESKIVIDYDLTIPQILAEYCKVLYAAGLASFPRLRKIARLLEVSKGDTHIWKAMPGSRVSESEPPIKYLTVNRWYRVKGIDGGTSDRRIPAKGVAELSPKFGINSLGLEEIGLELCREGTPPVSTRAVDIKALQLQDTGIWVDRLLVQDDVRNSDIIVPIPWSTQKSGRERWAFSVLRREHATRWSLHSWAILVQRKVCDCPYNGLVAAALEHDMGKRIKGSGRMCLHHEDMARLVIGAASRGMRTDWLHPPVHHSYCVMPEQVSLQLDEAEAMDNDPPWYSYLPRLFRGFAYLFGA